MEAGMTSSFRRSLITLCLIGAVVGGVSTSTPEALQAQASANSGVQNRTAKEHHLVLQNSIQQNEGVKDRLRKAPSDFGGHKETAIDAIDHALTELQQAVQYDQK
jgi:hypothetical protein